MLKFVILAKRNAQMGNRLPQNQELKTDNQNNNGQHIFAGGKQYFTKIIYEIHEYSFLFI